METFSIQLFELTFSTQLICELTFYVKDFLCSNLSNPIFHDNFCTARDDTRAFYRFLLKDLSVWPNHKYVTSVYSPLNADPLRQLVIRLGLPDSCVPESILEGFRAEEDARRWDPRWEVRTRWGVQSEPLFERRQPFRTTDARYIVREINSRRALFDRQHSEDEPVYAPIICY